MFRQPAELSITLLCFTSRLERVSSSVTRVTGHMRGSSSVTTGTSNGAGGFVIRISGGGVGGDGGGAGGTAFYLTTHPGAGGFDGFARTVILRMLLFE